MKHHKLRGESYLLALALLIGTPAVAVTSVAGAAVADPTVTAEPTPGPDPTVPEPTVAPEPTDPGPTNPGPTDPGPTVPGPTAPAGDVAPAGRYALNTTAIWTSQTVLLTEASLVDPDSEPATVRRVVTWGDGSAPQAIATGARSIRHRYARAGTFAVSVRLTDGTANQVAGVMAGAASVRVTATPGTYRLDRTAAWTYRVVNKAGTAWQESAPVPLTLTMAGVPANVSRIRVDWGEGFERLYPRTAKKAVLRYYGGPAHRVTVSLENANGRSASRLVGTFKVTLDIAAPTLSINKPANANRVASWRTITGKASDRGVGVRTVKVSLTQWRGASIYYYTGSAWRKATSPEDASRRAVDVRASYAKGSWKLAVKGMAKGYLQVAAYAEEPGGIWSGWRYREQDITK